MSEGSRIGECDVVEVVLPLYFMNFPDFWKGICREDEGK